MDEISIKQKIFRLVPSKFPPIQLFENLLDPDELDLAYALESLTNPRLRDEAGDIRLVPKAERVTGSGTSAIMAAFTHIGMPSRFTDGSFGVYYAGLDLTTALTESRFSRERLMRATNEAPQKLTMRCYSCVVDANLLDVREQKQFHHPDDLSASQNIGKKLKQQNAMGLLYQSVRRQGGECVAVLRPSALVPPAVQAKHYQFHWDGESISTIVELSEIKL